MRLGRFAWVALVFTALEIGSVVSGRAQATGLVSTSGRESIAAPEKFNALFKLRSMGQTEQYGIRFRFENYEASDGVSLTFYCLENGDQAQAIEAFTQKINHAFRVVKSSKKTGKNGMVVGETADILDSSTKSTPPVRAVIWTDGTTFYEIASRFLEHLLEFEKYHWPSRP
jgi:hypothetical protein